MRPGLVAACLAVAIVVPASAGASTLVSTRAVLAAFASSGITLRAYPASNGVVVMLPAGSEARSTGLTVFRYSAESEAIRAAKKDEAADARLHPGAEIVVRRANVVAVYAPGRSSVRIKRALTRLG